MSARHLKRPMEIPAAHGRDIEAVVRDMLQDLEARGELAVQEYSKKLDSWSPDSFIVTEKEVAEAGRSLPDTVREDIEFAHRQVRAFADRQRESLLEFEAEMYPGLWTGQRHVPVNVAGCYVPGGRFAHVASAAMSIATAKAAGVPNIIACSPPREGAGIHPATLYGMGLAGADTIMCLGGVQAIGAMTFGLFTGLPADVLAGPGNAYVAEAKRVLYGRVGIDVFAGPTEALIIADDTANPDLLAVDLISQAEHGLDSATVLISTSQQVAEKTILAIPAALAALPESSVASISWERLGEVVVVDSRDEAAELSDVYASEHVEVHAADLDWWLGRLTNYGSLFLGEETTVTYGDKTSGPNHILPTKGAARYTGGLWVGKFLKTLTYQRMTRAASRDIGEVAGRISRLEGMEGHALAAEKRVEMFGSQESPGGSGTRGVAISS